MSTTGLHEMSAAELPSAINYLDNTCPKCCCKMIKVETYERGIKVNCFYECSNCGYKAPICHEGDFKNNKTIPLNDNMLRNFIKSFGK